MTVAQTSARHSQTNKLTGLYAITDEHLITESRFSQTIEFALQGGAKIIQYRDKSKDQKKRYQQATALRMLCEQYQAVCIINDDIELAKAVNAHGVHLGQNDIPLTKARRTLGENAIIGISCYNDLTLAREAEKKSANYVAFGAIFSSPTKPGAIIAGLDIISQARQQLSIPICTIGGITNNNIQQVIQHGADMAAVISSIFTADDVIKTTKELTRHFNFL